MRAICLTGGIGDLLMSLPILRCLEAECGPFDVFTPNADAFKVFTLRDAHPLTEDWTLPPEFDCILELSSMGRFLRIRGEGAHLAVALRNKTFIETHDLFEACRKYPLLDGDVAKKATTLGFNRRTFPAAMLGYDACDIKPIDLGHIEELNYLFPQRYVTIHSGVGLNHAGKVKRPTKTWDKSHLEELCALIHQEYADIQIVQLGDASTSTKIKGADVCFFGLNLKQTIGIMKGSELHIDGESGLVHIAHNIGLKSVVMFGPTPASHFGYEENINLVSPFCSPCWWSNDTWLAQCPKNYKAPLCMNMILPTTVMDAVRQSIIN